MDPHPGAFLCPDAGRRGQGDVADDQAGEADVDQGGGGDAAGDELGGEHRADQRGCGEQHPDQARGPGVAAGDGGETARQVGQHGDEADGACDADQAEADEPTVAQHAEVEHGVLAPVLDEREDGEDDDRVGEQGDDTDAAPAPLRALHDGGGQQHHGNDEEGAAREVDTGSGGAGDGHRLGDGGHGDQYDHEGHRVHGKHPAPAEGPDERAGQGRVRSHADARDGAEIGERLGPGNS
ncbi:hypothetical protein ACWEC4_28395 [Streptomyces sp. NPDC005055]